MSDDNRSSISVTRGLKNALDDAKLNDGESYETLLWRLLETEAAAADPDDLAERIVDQIGADVGGPRVDDSELARAVARELDYANLADQVADRVVSDLRDTPRA